MRCFVNVLALSFCVSVASLMEVPTANAAGGERSSATSVSANVKGARLAEGSSAQKDPNERYGDLPLSFEANQGQTDSHVRFLSRGSGYSFFLTRDGAMLTFARDSRSDATVLQMQLAGADPNAQIHGLDELPGKSNYFFGNDAQRWRTAVPTYSKVAYENVYPGINLVYYGNQRQLEYDFVLAPGANPQQIRLAVSGAEKLAVDARGNLILHGATADVQLLAPKVYQLIQGHKREVFGQWHLAANNTAGFRIGNYDRTQPLVIDPVLTYSSFLGGSQKNALNKIAIDSAGNAYVAGYTASGDFPAAPTPQAVTFGGGTPSRGAFVAKIDPTGSTLLYSTYLSGSVDEEATGLAVDNSGSVYVAGTTHSTDFPTRNAFQSTCATHTQAGTCSSAFLTKIGPTGDSLSFSTYLGGSGGESARSLAIDAAGSAYVAGVTSSVDFPVTSKAAQANCAGGCQQNAFVAKFTPSGDSLAYATYLGGSGLDDAADIAVDATGNAYLTGRTTSSDFPLAAPYQKSCAMDATSSSGACVATAFVTKIRPDGSGLAYSTYLGGSLGSQASAIAVDSLGSAYVTGSTQSSDFPLAKPFQKSCPKGAASGQCGIHAFVSKLAPSGKTLVYSTYLGGSGRDEASGIAVDAAGNAHIVGRTESSDFPTAASVQKQLKGVSDAFVARFNAGGSAITFSTYHGGSEQESGNAIALDAKGNVYLTGVTSSPDFPTQHAFQSSCAGACANAFVTKMAPPPAVTPLTIAKAFGAATIPLNGTTTLTFTITNPDTVTTQTGIAFADNLPAGLVVANPPNVLNLCGGTVTATAGSSLITLSSGTLAPLASCTLSVDTNGTTAGAKNNSVQVSSTEGGTGNTSNASVDVVAPPSIAKVFNPTTIALNGTSTLTFTITNPAANTVAETGVAFTDTLPAGLVVSTPNGLTNTCGGTATAVAGSSSITLTGGTIAVNTSCTVVVNVTGTAAGQYTNTSGAVSSINGGTGNTASANLTVAAPPTITKAFGLPDIPVNGTTSLTFTIHNPNTSSSLTGIAFTDNLPAGLVVATPNGLTNNCGGTATGVAGSGQVSLSGGTLAASASCTVGVTIEGTTAGVKNNSVQVTSTEGGTGNTSNASITVVAAPTLAKAFGAATIPLNGTTTLTFTVTNPSTTITVNGIAFTDNLPAGIVVSTPNGLTGTCGGGTITAVAGSSSVSLSGASLAASSSCNFHVNVDGTSAGVKTNTTSNVTSTNGGTGNSATASMTVVAPPSIAKIFTPSTVVTGTTTSLTFTITNPVANTVALTGVAFTDTLPAGLTVANASVAVCGGTLTTTNPTGIALAGATIAASGQCQFSVTVTGAASGNYTNTTGNVTSTNGGTGNTASANLTVATPPTILKAFGVAAIPLSTTTSLTFTITNPNTAVTLTGIAFTDNLPAGLVVATPSNLNTTCTGTATAAAGSGSVSLSSATLAGSASCTVSANVKGTTAGVKNNSVQVSSTEGGTGNTSNATITVVAPPTLAKVFGNPSIALNSSTSLGFTVTNPNTTSALTNIAFSDTLPAGLIISTPSGLTGSCGGGTITATQNTNVISLATATLAATGSCTFSVNVTGTAAGTQNNTTGTITSTEGGTGLTASASVIVVAPPVIAKAFGAVSIPLNATTTLTFTITNPAANTAAEAGVAFTDTLPAGLVVATPNGLSNTCNGTATATAGTTGISLTGGSIAVNTPCTVVVDILGTTAGGPFTNTSGAVSSTNGGTGNTATANLTVVAPPTIAKAFSPTPITLGAPSTLTFTITNPSANTVAENGVAFTDTLPTNLTVASATATVCGGTLTTTNPTGISLSGATVAVNSQCQFTVTVTGTTGGLNIPNTTGAVSSSNGGTGTTSNTATITVQDYSFSATDTTSTFIQGSTVPGAASMNITPLYTYGGTVSSAGCAPAGFNCTFTATNIGGTNLPVSITAAANTPVGPYPAITLSATGTALNSGPAIIHSAAPFSLFVECTYSLGDATINNTVPMFTPSVTAAPYSLFVTEVAGGSNCPWGPSANAPLPAAAQATVVQGTATVTIVSGSTGQVSAPGTGSPLTFSVTPITTGDTVPQVDQITVSYFQVGGTNNVGSSTFNIVQEIPVLATVNAGVSGSATMAVSSSAAGNLNNQTGWTLTFAPVQGLSSGAPATFCSATALQSDGTYALDPNGLNYGISCTQPAAVSLAGSPGTFPLQITAPAGLEVANGSNPESGKPLFVYALFLGLPAIVFLGTGTMARGSWRRRPTMKRLTSILAIFWILALLVGLPSCAGGFNANFGGNKAAAFSLTVMGYVTDGSSANAVQGEEIFTVPLTIVK